MIRCVVFQYNKLESPSSKDALRKSLLKVCHVVLEKIFKSCQCNFTKISLYKKKLPFIWTNLNPLNSRMLCAKFGWHWTSGSRKEAENVKSLRMRTITKQTKDKFDQKSSREPSAQVTFQKKEFHGVYNLWSVCKTLTYFIIPISIKCNPIPSP